MKRITRIINYVLLFALMVTFIPLQTVNAAASFFLPDDGQLAATANKDISSDPAHIASLNRTTAKITNSGTISINGTFQQVTGNTIMLTVDQITSRNGGAWTAESGRTFNTAVGATSNRFTVNGVQLFPGYNRLTVTGTQGGSTKTDVFYVLYDTAPLINTLQITSNNQNYDLNEGTSLVVTSSTAFIQGNAGNATTVSVNGQNASLLSNGLFYAPALTLTPGLNKFDIILSNATDSVTVKRQVYYYSASKPFTNVTVTEGSQTQSLLGATPTLTDVATTASLTLEFLVPYQVETFDNAHATIKINTQTPDPTIVGTASETVIYNTYGAKAYKLVKFTTTPIDLQLTGAVINDIQPISVSIAYPNTIVPPITISDTFSFNHVNGIVVKNVSLLPSSYTGGAVDDTIATVPFNGSQVTGPDFYVLVDASQALIAGDLKIALQPLGTTTIGLSFVGVTATGSNNKGQVYQITGLPEGSQTVAFSVGSAPVSYTGKITYVSKIYVDLDNLYDDQVFTVDTAATVAPIILKGKIIGFGTKILNKQLIINNSTVTFPTISTMNPDGSYDISATNMVVGGNPATDIVLFTGRNVLKILIDYSDGATPAGALRKYVKEVTFYVVDTNTPNISSVRPLTPPLSTSTSVRGSLANTNPSVYLPASPEFILNNGTYKTTLSKFDLFVEGSGADTINIKEGATVIYTAAVPPLSVPSGNTYYESVDASGPRAGFRIRLNNVSIPTGIHVYTIEFTNTSGAKVTQTLTVESQNVPYRVLSPLANTGSTILVNKNFVWFDVEAVGATDVQINGKSATLRTDVTPNRYTYTLTGLKGDSDNKITLVVKNGTASATETIVVKYVTNTGAGTMFMEPLGTKHSVFNKELQLTFPKGNVLRRAKDGKIEPQGNLLFGIANPKDGNTELINDYNQVLGSDIDFRTKPSPTQTIIPIDSSLSTQFSNELGRDHFTRISEYYWISGGLGEKLKVGDPLYKTVTGGLAPYSTEGTFTRYDSDRVVVPSERGTLTIKYNDSVVDQAGAEITVFYLGDDGFWKNIGGEVDTKAKTIQVPFDNFGYYMVGKLKYSYDDISNHDWARNILQSLLSKGYMPALRANEFGTADYITRGEFAALLVRSLGMRINSDDNNTFIDIVPASRSVAWSYEEIETAARAGIVQGLNNQIFGADRELTRQDAAVMISRAVNLKLAVNDDKLKAKLDKAFADSTGINTYARSAVDALNSGGIMVGSPVISPIPTKAKPLLNFNPISNLTRAEAGQISVRLLQKYLKALPANLS